MSQRTLLIALAILAVLIFAGIAAFIGGAGFGLAGSDIDNSRRANYVAGEDDPFAEPAAGIEFTGRDEHGRYYVGPGGERTYVDSSGRRYVIGPDGKRIYVDERGRPVRDQGSGGASGEGSGTTGTGTGEAGTPENPDEPPETEAPPADLSGKVVDDHGQPYPGATVVAQIVGGEARSMSSNEEGGFVFAGLPSGKPLVVTARDAWGNTSKPVNTRLAKGNVALKEPLVLPRDTAIRGIVRAADTGQPLDGAQVLLFGTTGQFGQVLSTQASHSTDAGGGFVFEKLTPAAYRLQITREGYTPRILNSVEPPETLTVEMSPGAVISGTVTDLGGNPIAGAKVSCDFRAEPAQHFHTDTLTDAAGFYAVKCQPESQHNTVTVIASGFKSASRTLMRSGAENVNFELAPSGNVVLRGRLLKTGGVPVVAASFQSFQLSGKSANVVQSMGPGADGGFWCEVLPAAVTLRISSPGLAQLVVDYTPVPGGEVDLGDLYFNAGFVVYGVVHQAGQPALPIADATVSSEGISAKTDAEGKYRLEGLPEKQTYNVRATHIAWATMTIGISRADEAQEYRLDFGMSHGSHEMVVRVTDAETAEPLPGAKVTATAYGQTVVTDADGRAHLVEMSSANVAVRVELAGYATVETTFVAKVPAEEAPPPEHTVALSRGSVLSGVCTSAGAPLPGATRVEVWDATKRVATIFTDTDGAYTTESLPIGQYFVGLPDFHFAARPVELTEEGTEFDIEIGPISHARGRMLRGDGSPHANAGVYIYRRDEVFWCATIHTGPNGEYEVSNLFPGVWVFCALKTQGDTAAQFAVDVNLNKAGWNDVDVHLPSSTGVMTGRVTYPDGSPVKRARVAVTNLSANFPRALLAAYVVTDDDGYYTAERLENGMQMQARVGGYQDDAQTGTAFGEVVIMPGDNTAVQADIVVATTGVTVRVAMRRADGGPIQSGGPLSYVFDSEGRLAGLFFGGGTYVGHIDIYDVVPGNYTLVVTNRGMKRATLQFTVASENIMSGLEVLIELDDRGEE
jgi:hypothetical protein